MSRTKYYSRMRPPPRLCDFFEMSSFFFRNVRLLASKSLSHAQNISIGTSTNALSGKPIFVAYHLRTRNSAICGKYVSSFRVQLFGLYSLSPLALLALYYTVHVDKSCTRLLTCIRLRYQDGDGVAAVARPLLLWRGTITTI